MITKHNSNGLTSEWIRIRQHLYKQILARVLKMEGVGSKGLRNYKRSYERDCRKPWKTSSRKVLIAEAEKADLVVVGDFHALKQAQRTQLRILQAIRRRPVVLAVECVPASQQLALNRWLKGQLEDEAFIEKIQWKKNWGFPWENFLPLFIWAKEQGVPVYGINKIYCRRDSRTLKMRDQFAAECVARIRARHPEALVVILYGDLHLAQSHLPKSLKEALPHEKLVRIFQNVESISFEMMERNLDLKTDVVKLGPGHFCVQSITPWVKWQNYLNFLETQITHEDDEETEQDQTDQVEQYITLLSKEMQRPWSSGSIEVVSPLQARAGGRLWSRIRRRVSSDFIPIYRHWIETGESFYIPELRLAFLSRSTVNHIARLASSAFCAQVGGWETYPTRNAKGFQRWIFIESLVYFCGKLINPRRKTDTIHDIQRTLSLKLNTTQNREVLQLALSYKLQEKVGGFRRGSPVNFRPRSANSYVEAARLLGGMNGEKLYDLFRKQILSLEEVQTLFRLDLSREGFEKEYWKFIQLLGQHPDPFLSKRDKL